MNVYARITRLILEKLESGTVPWHQPWSGDSWPQNLITRHRYRGINVFILTTAGYASPFWLTFRQAKKLNGKVRKKERGTPIVYWRLLKKSDDEGQEYHIPLLRYYTVFNVEQCEGIEKPEIEGIKDDWQPLEQCEQIIEQMPDKPLIETGAARAYFDIRRDRINLPARELFESSEDLYCTLFHELIHSTGHQTRLDRKTVSQATYYGSTNYSKEELIAEMGAAFLCGHTGIINKTLDNSAAYINGWFKRLEKDKRLLISAAAQAHRAFAYILDLPAETPAVTEDSEKQAQPVLPE